MIAQIYVVHFAILGVVLIGNPDSVRNKTFSSTKHGFSFAYPASWIQEGVGGCGHDYEGLSKDDLDRILFPSVYLYAERSTEGQPLRPGIHVMYQAVRSDQERQSDEEPLPIACGTNSSAGTCKFTTEQGLSGRKIVYQARLGGPTLVSSIQYWFPHHGRLLFLHCVDGGRGLHELEQIFDAVVNSVTMTEPFTESSRLFQKDCATVAYPADWSRTKWSFENDRESFRIEAPHTGKKVTATIQLLFDDRLLTQYESESRESLSRNAHWFEIAAFTNSKEQQGLKISAEIGFGKTNKTTWFVLPCSDGRLAVLFCWDHDNDDVDWEPMFSIIAASFVVE